MDSKTYGSMRTAVAAATKIQAQQGGVVCVVSSTIRRGYWVVTLAQAKTLGARPLYVVCDR